jgi:hypothetical protein
VTTNEEQPRVIGYEILRRVAPSEIPQHTRNPRTARAVLGARESRYLLPPGIDIFELGILDTAGRYELLPIDARDRPLWDHVIHLLVTADQVARQRALLLRAYRTLCTSILEADKLKTSVAEWSERRAAHPIFGLLRLKTIEVWRTMRQPSQVLTEREIDELHAEVALRVAAKIRAHVIR